MRVKDWFILHPFLLGVFPILFLFAQNAKQMRPEDVFLPLSFAFGFVTLATLLLNLAIRNIRKTGLIVSLVCILFLSYGHLLSFFHVLGFEFNPMNSKANVALLCLLAMMIVLAVYFILQSKSTLKTITSILNGMSVILVGMQLVLGGYVLVTRQAVDEVEHQYQSGEQSSDTSPNIYYIILDGYTGEDVLERVFEFDNSDFLEYLESKGFYVARKGRSNYAQTLLSLTSSLNMDYTDKLGEYDLDDDDRVPLERLYQNNAVFGFLRERGYQIVSFATGYNFTEVRKADLYLEPDRNVSEFQGLLLSTTPLPFIFQRLESPFVLQRNRINYALDKLTDLSRLKQPYFVFAHIVAPHPPFVFGENGVAHERNRPFDHEDGHYYFIRGGTEQEYKNGYRNQIRVLNQRMKIVVDSIIAEAKERQSVIIIQGDHGSGFGVHWDSVEKTDLKERFSILNAYYLPVADPGEFTPVMTPVNSFRRVFNVYFDTHYEMLPERMFYSTWDLPFRLIDVTDRLDDSKKER